MRRIVIWLAAALGLIGGPAPAENLALLLGDRGQAAAFRDPQDIDAETFRRTLRGAGFRVIEPASRDIRDMRLAALGLESAVESGTVDRLLIVAMGPFATDGHDSWILSNDAASVTRISVGALGISMSALSDVAARQDIPAVIMASPGRTLDTLGPGLRGGLGPFVRHEGVSYVTGPAPALADLLEGLVLVDGVSYAELARNAPRDVRVEGNLSAQEGLMGPAAPPVSEVAVELGFWRAVQTLDTIDAYRAYLAEYPRGTHAREARARIDQLREAPGREAKAAEERLGLSREDRQEIQRNLALLGHDPRGIDGILGPGSRSAIRAWQKANGFPETGYLSGNQLRLLREQARAEAQRQEREAEKRRLREERQDRAYWHDTGKGADEAGLRAYLRRYPDGLYADIARERLAEIEARTRAEARREEREAWDAARMADTEEAYRAFLNSYPDSRFAAAAKARLDELTEAGRNAEVIARAREEERQFTGTLVARILIEKRLQQFGINPGPADGNFDHLTRRAIRRFQRERDLPVTGYISRDTMVRLMAGR